MKFYRYFPIAFFIAFNVGIFVGFDAIASGDVGLVASLSVGLQGAPAPAAGIFIAGILNTLVEPEYKARIVFWRWTKPMPGSRAFSVYGLKDPRVNLGNIAKKFGKLPTSSKDENIYWYKLYKKLRESGSEVIENSNMRYVIYRDLCVMAAMLIAVLVPASYFYMGGIRSWLMYAGFMALQFVVLRIAAKNAGVRLVTNVLAYSS